MGIAERKIRQKEEVRCSILTAAWQVVKEEGWQSLSIRKIADAIEYSVPVIYDHFENKEAILLEFTKKGFRLLTDSLEEAANHQTDPEIKLEVMAYAYWQFAFDHKEYYQLMYGVGMPGCETVKRVEELNRFTSLVKTVIEALADKNGRKDLDPFLKLHTFWSMLHGLISINMLNKGGEDELNVNVMKDFIKGFVTAFKK